MTATTLSTDDVERARSACAQVYFPHRLRVLHDHRHFRMHLSAVSTGPVAAGVLSYAGEVVIETAELETGYEVNVPLDGPLRTSSGDREVCATPTCAALYRPDARARLHGWAGGGRLFGLKIERDALEAHLGALLGRPVRSPVALAPSLDLTTAGGRQWWWLAQTVAELAAAPDGLVANPLVLRPLTQGLVAALLLTAQHPDRDALDAAPPRPGSAAVRRAAAAVEERPDHPWTPADLARHVGLSVRGLHDGFARQLGVTPMGLVRDVRLGRAHADLLAADPATTSVAAVASRWGFAHFGRFADAHRRRYGEHPSATLRR
ncbi:AraC family transcriptional regulator [Actinomycetospora sp. TBRC 11914]|uniref:AraC family transcriptional regulator n=1 Tax=Actinomycetospora sp. TBRC 11914 TaxID=2729387 RepID=UPI00145DB280|nr:AraC family transcriptional regulator [Actinomycetospora sp. TBRC 11914]NMO90504.1 AraC family transcriptional regulator [Actinomycetospora sp. TBRC 11914]